MDINVPIFISHFIRYHSISHFCTFHLAFYTIYIPFIITAHQTDKSAIVSLGHADEYFVISVANEISVMGNISESGLLIIGAVSIL